jgi:HK97 family phage major capsid protein
MLSGGKHAVRKLKRAQILLAADAGVGDEAIASSVSVSVNYSFRLQEDKDCFNADGTSTYSGATGLAKALSGTFSAISSASGHHSADLIDSTDVEKTMSSILGSALGGAEFYTSPSGFGLFSRLSSASGGMLGTTNPDGTVSASYLGFPIQITAALGTPAPADNVGGSVVFYFGNLEMSSVFVQSRPTTVDVSRERLAEFDSFLLRASERISILHHDTGDSITRSPIASLTASS